MIQTLPSVLYSGLAWWFWLPLLFVLLVLSGRFTALGMPNLFIPDAPGSWLRRARNGLWVSILIAILALDLMLTPAVERAAVAAQTAPLSVWFWTHAALAIVVVGALATLLLRSPSEAEERASTEANLDDPEDPSSEEPDSDEAKRRLEGLQRPGRAASMHFLGGFAGGAVAIGVLIRIMQPLFQWNAGLHVLPTLLLAGAGVYLWRVGRPQANPSPAMSVCSLLAVVALVGGFFGYLQVHGLLVLAGVVALAVVTRAVYGDPYVLAGVDRGTRGRASPPEERGASRTEPAASAPTAGSASPAAGVRDEASKGRHEQPEPAAVEPTTAEETPHADSVQGGAASRRVRVPLSRVEREERRDRPIPLSASGHHWGRGPERQPLILVCCNGGGARAAVWTVHALLQIEQACARASVAFRPHLIFGASGGMLGAVRYATKADLPADRVLRQIEADGLEDMVQHFVARDLPWSLLPIPRPQQPRHRGDVIESTWARHFGWNEPKTFGDLNGAPHLVFSPMCVEDGRRFIMSHLDLFPLTQARGPELKSGTSHVGQRYTTAAFQWTDLFGDESLRNTSLLEAARLSATFPYVMPISSVETKPRRRLVDAGYYDNHGTSLASAWLEWTLRDDERRRWLEQRVERVVVVQIRSGVLDLTKPLSEVPARHRSVVSAALENLAGPMRALLSHHSASQLFGNDERLADVLEDLNRSVGRDDFATTVSFELGVDAALSWSLSEREKEAIRIWARSPKTTSRAADVAAFIQGSVPAHSGAA
ncbi:MAG TPA: patatin-like phospholipase family protein [Myxococcales bacterium LLY-WYZ-16_1]|nr:patatin-like phospholipase family protein [Myxococcales bacterium LLY-WYZ-16_1]